MINNLQRAIVLERLISDVEADDPNDTFLLTMALVGEADYLVTEDRRAGLLQRGNFGRNRIVTPGTFCSEALRLRGIVGRPPSGASLNQSEPIMPIGEKHA